MKYLETLGTKERHFVIFRRQDVPSRPSSHSMKQDTFHDQSWVEPSRPLSNPECRRREVEDSVNVPLSTKYGGLGTQTEKERKDINVFRDPVRNKVK